MTDPGTLRPEVREALDKLRACVLRCDPRLDPRVATIRAELLRLAGENAALHESALGGYEDGWHALRNERDALKAELAALRHAADTFMAAVVSYHSNPWDRANVRGYDAAETALRRLVREDGE